MAQYQTGDGRWLVGDVTGESSYHGFLGWRDCVIQLTGEGATEQSVHYLEALRDYALAHNPLGEPIMPPSINVWISNNGTTTAVQADDLSIDGDKFTIGGIVWDGSTWDYSDAGKASGGGSGGGLVVTFAASGQDISADKTYADIVSAVKSGSPVFGVVTSGGAVRAQLIFSAFANHIGAIFLGFDTTVSNELRVTSVIVKEDDTVSGRRMFLAATT